MGPAPSDIDAFIHRDLAGVEDVAGGGDRFGYAVAVGDFNGDFLADVAVGAPFDDIGGVGDAGSVHVFYGTVLGLGFANDQVWDQDSTGVPGTASAGDQFGYALTTGDFNGDGYVDLAVGIPFKDIGALTDTGSVSVLYGSSAGLTATGSQLWNQNVSAMQDICEPGDRFGWAMAAGDFDGDGFDELAVGAPNEDVDAVADAGVVHIIQGTLGGLTDAGNQMWVEDNGGLPDVSEAGDLFGFALATGDFDGDGYADLGIGVPLEDAGAVVDAGSVTVIYGTATGLLTTGSQAWNQNTTGILGTAETSDVFGRSLEAGDFNSDGYADLAIGAPFDDVGTINSAGAMQIIPGGSAGLTDIGDELWHQDTAGVTDTAEASDNFSYRLRAGDYNGDAIVDLVVGVPFESIGAVGDAGALHYLPGSTSGITTTGATFWSQDSPNILDTSEASDRFSHGL